jgi:hypothetical protein
VHIQAGGGGGGPIPRGAERGGLSHLPQSFEPDELVSVSAFPNPATGNKITLNVQADKDYGNANFSLRSISGGKVILDTRRQLLKGTNQLSLQLPKSPPGVYVMHLSTDSGIHAVTKVILK